MAKKSEYMGVFLTTYIHWDDPPSGAMFFRATFRFVDGDLQPLQWICGRVAMSKKLRSPDGTGKGPCMY